MEAEKKHLFRPDSQRLTVKAIEIEDDIRPAIQSWFEKHGEEHFDRELELILIGVAQEVALDRRIAWQTYQDLNNPKT